MGWGKGSKPCTKMKTICILEIFEQPFGQPRTSLMAQRVGDEEGRSHASRKAQGRTTDGKKRILVGGKNRKSDLNVQRANLTEPSRKGNVS